MIITTKNVKATSLTYLLYNFICWYLVTLAFIKILNSDISMYIYYLVTAIVISISYIIFEIKIINSKSKDAIISTQVKHNDYYLINEDEDIKYIINTNDSKIWLNQNSNFGEISFEEVLMIKTRCSTISKLDILFIHIYNYINKIFISAVIFTFGYTFFEFSFKPIVIVIVIYVVSFITNTIMKKVIIKRNLTYFI